MIRFRQNIPGIEIFKSEVETKREENDNFSIKGQ